MKKSFLLLLTLAVLLAPLSSRADNTNQLTEYKLWLVPCTVSVAVQFLPQGLSLMYSRDLMHDAKTSQVNATTISVFEFALASAASNVIALFAALPLTIIAYRRLDISEGCSFRKGARRSVEVILVGAVIAESAFQFMEFKDLVYLFNSFPQAPAGPEALTPTLITGGISSAIAVIAAVTGLGTLFISCIAKKKQYEAIVNQII